MLKKSTDIQQVFIFQSIVDHIVLKADKTSVHN